MATADVILFEGDTDFDHYQVVDTVYEGRYARVIYSGDERAAQSGVARDGKPNMLFDYNQRFLELAVGMQPRTVLVIGGGCYTLPVALVQALPQVDVDVIERDAGLDAIAAKFFGVVAGERLRIIHDDGAQYLKANQLAYDMVVVDVFEHTKIPPAFMSLSLIMKLAEVVQGKGVVAMNIISAARGPLSGVLGQLRWKYRSIFSNVQVFPADDTTSRWRSQNFVLTASQANTDFSNYVKFSAVDV